MNSVSHDKMEKWYSKYWHYLSLDTYIPSDSNKEVSRYGIRKSIFTTSSENIAIVRHGIFLVTISLLVSQFLAFSEFISGKLIQVGNG